MIISFKHRFIFIKNRKVGGTSLEKYLIDKVLDTKTDINTGSIHDNYPSNNIKKIDGGEVSGHLSIIDISKILKKNLEELMSSFYIFSIERNPFDKCVSSYYFHKKDESFLDFLKNSKYIPKDWNKYTLNNNIIGRIYLYEEFEKIFDSLNVILNLKNNFKLNLEEFKAYNFKSNYRPKNLSYQRHYCEESKNLVKDYFFEELDSFKYEF